MKTWLVSPVIIKEWTVSAAALLTLDLNSPLVDGDISIFRRPPICPSLDVFMESTSSYEIVFIFIAIVRCWRPLKSDLFFLGWPFFFPFSSISCFSSSLSSNLSDSSVSFFKIYPQSSDPREKKFHRFFFGVERAISSIFYGIWHHVPAERLVILPCFDE